MVGRFFSIQLLLQKWASEANLSYLIKNHPKRNIHKNRKSQKFAKLMEKITDIAKFIEIPKIPKIAKIVKKN